MSDEVRRTLGASAVRVLLDWFRARRVSRPSPGPVGSLGALESEWLPAVVIARLTATTLRVVLFPGSGMADGGIAREVPLIAVPPELRVPNTQLDVLMDRGTNEVVTVRRAERRGFDP